MQVGANEFLNGREVGAVGSGRVVRSCSSTLFRSFILFLIITNIFAVLAESIPEVDRWAVREESTHQSVNRESDIVLQVYPVCTMYTPFTAVYAPMYTRYTCIYTT